jgi:hypothetical protein
MANENLIEQLRLSNNPFFQQAAPESAAAFVLKLQAALQAPEAQDALANLGLSAQDLIDVPSTAEAIAEMRGEPVTTGEKIQSALIDEPIAGIQDFLSEFGIGEGGGPVPTTATRFPDDLPAFGGAPVARTLGTIVPGIGAIAATLPFSTAAAGAAGLTGAAQGIAGFAAATGGLQLGREIGQKLAKDDPISLKDILSETAFGAAAGVPGGRIVASTTAAATAAALNALGAEIPDERIAAELVFAAAFGNPRLAKALDRRTLKGTFRPKAGLRDPLSQINLLRQETTKIADPAAREALQAKINLAEVLKDSKTLPELQTAERTLEPGEAAAVLRFAINEITGSTAPSTTRGKFKDPDLRNFKVVESDVLQTADVMETSGLSLGERLRRLGQREKAQEVPAAQRLSVNAGKMRDTILNSNTGNVVQDSIDRVLNDLRKQLSEAENAAEAQLAHLPVPAKSTISAFKRVKQLRAAIQRVETEPRSVHGVIRPAAKSMAEIIVRDIDNIRDLNAYRRALNKSELREFKEVMDPIFKTRLVQLRLKQGRANFTKETNAIIRRLQTFGVDLVDPFENAAANIVAGINASGKKVGQIRALGKMEEVIPSVVEAIGSPRLSSFVGKLSPADMKLLAGEVNGRLFRPKVRRIKEIKELRDMASRYGGMLEDNLQFSIKGRVKQFSGLAEANRFFDSLESGRLDTLEKLDLAASRRGLSFKHVGDGEVLVANPRTGEFHNVNRGDADKLIRETPEPTGTEFVGESEMRRWGVLPQDQFAGPVHILEETIEGIRGRISDSPFIRMFSTMRKLTQQMESKYPSIRAFSQLFAPLDKAQTNRAAFERPWLEKLGRMRRRVRRTRRHLIQQVWVSRNRDALYDEFGFNAKERGVVEELDKMYGVLTDTPIERIKEVYRMQRRTGGKIYTDEMWHRMPKGLEFARDGMSKSQRIDMVNDDFVTSFASLMNERSRDFFIKPIEGRVREVLDAANNIKGEEGGFMQTTLNRIASQVIDGNDQSARAITALVENTTNIFRKTLGMEPAEIKPKDVQKVMNQMSVFFAGSAMAMRPALVIRNMFQSMLPAFKVGYTTNFQAMKQVASNPKKVRQLAREAGAVRDLDAIFLADEVATPNPGLVTMIQEAQRIGLVPFRTADTWNRMVSFMSGRLTVLKHKDKLLKNNDLDSFLLHSGLAGDSLVVQKQVVNALRAGDIEHAANFYGKFLADDTQFVYSRINSPLAFQGATGRLFGQFGIWPISYAEYIARNAVPYSKLGTLSPGIAGSHGRRFVARWFSMLAAIGALGTATGIDTSSFNFANPLSFEGGPYFQALKNAPEALLGQDEFRRDLARRNLQRFFKTAVIPFQGLATDIDQAFNEDDPLTAWLLLMGFNPRKQRAR